MTTGSVIWTNPVSMGSRSSCGDNSRTMDCLASSGPGASIATGTVRSIRRRNGDCSSSTAYLLAAYLVWENAWEGDVSVDPGVVPGLGLYSLLLDEGESVGLWPGERGDSCGPGPAWLATCVAGQQQGMATGEIVILLPDDQGEFSLNSPEIWFEMTGEMIVQHGTASESPLAVETELVSLALNGSAFDWATNQQIEIRVRGGDGEGNLAADNALYSPGQILELRRVIRWRTARSMSSFRLIWAAICQICTTNSRLNSRRPPIALCPGIRRTTLSVRVRCRCWMPMATPSHNSNTRTSRPSLGWTSAIRPFGISGMPPIIPMRHLSPPTVRGTWWTAVSAWERRLTPRATLGRTRRPRETICTPGRRGR